MCVLEGSRDFELHLWTQLKVKVTHWTLKTYKLNLKRLKTSLVFCQSN